MRLFNTLTKRKEEFIPIEPGKVRMYSCGPTVYNFFHIGNARPFIIFDTLRRYFEYKGLTVKFVQNFTDIDDKMIKRANEEGITVAQLAEKYINEYFTDSTGLGISKATVHPLATDNIDAIIELIKTLEDKGYAYNVNGDVYFSTKSFKDYGKLSHQPLEDLEAGARIEVNESKRSAMDFALWKSQKPGEPAWESPWGMGRPGWHIECSAMANRYLGKTIDIHSGGQDLIFPHHENEIAQSEAANGCEFARYWLHNGYINVDNQKMSKSLNNFFTVRDVAGEFGYETARFFMLSAHYRNPINFSRELIENSATALERLYNCVYSLDFIAENAVDRQPSNEENDAYNTIAAHKQRFIDAMEDDLNTADAVSVLFDMAREINTRINSAGSYSIEHIKRVKELFLELGAVLGLLQKEKEATIPAEITQLVNERVQARKDKDWALSDKLRDELKQKGYSVEDTPKGPKVTRV